MFFLQTRGALLTETSDQAQSMAGCPSYWNKWSSSSMWMGVCATQTWVSEKHMKHSQREVWTKTVKRWSTHHCCCLLALPQLRKQSPLHSSPPLSSSSVQSHKSRADRTRLLWRKAYIYRPRFGGKSYLNFKGQKRWRGKMWILRDWRWRGYLRSPPLLNCVMDSKRPPFMLALIPNGGQLGFLVSCMYTTTES
jgi:hypothetical protein